LTGVDDVVAKLRARIGLDVQKLLYSGVSLDDFIAIVFGLHAHVRGMDASALFQGLIHAAIDAKSFLVGSDFPQETFEVFLRNGSVPLGELRKQIRATEDWGNCTNAIEADNFATDFLAFRKHPIIDLKNGKYLIIDMQFVAELLFTGVFLKFSFH
jgi:hypothetical protein